MSRDAMATLVGEAAALIQQLLIDQATLVGVAAAVLLRLMMEATELLAPICFRHLLLFLGLFKETIGENEPTLKPPEGF